MNKRLEFGPAFSKVFDLYVKHVGPLLLWSAVVQLGISLLVALVVAAVLGGAGVGAALLAGAVAMAAAVVASAILTSAFIVGLSDSESTGAFPGFGDIWPRVKEKLGALIVTSLIAALGIALGFVLLVIPGLVLYTWWAVFAPVVILEDTSGTAALGRSRELVRGEGWTVFGLTVVVFIIAGIAGNIIGGIVGSILGGRDEFLGSFGGSFVSNTLTAPIGALLAIVIYEALTGGPSSEAPTGEPPAMEPAPDPTLPPSHEPPSGPFI